MDRRAFLGGALATGLSAAAAPAADRHVRGITVAKIEHFPLVVQEGRYGWVIVRVHTDSGLTGLGDASESGRGDPAIRKIQEYDEWWRGRSIFEIERFRQMAYGQREGGRGRPIACAFSGIEQALYDIQGQALGVPMHALFGGKVRDTVRNYANINRGSKSRTPQGFEPTARSAIEAGFDAVKIAPFDGMPKDSAGIRARTNEGIASVKLMREMFGDGDVLVEGHKNFDLERGLAVLPRLEPYNIFWFEEAIRSLEDMARLREQASMPIAGGEGLFGLAQALEYLQLGAVDILMPDIKWCAGALELKKISAMCEGADVQIAPHGPMGPIGSMAAAQVCSTLPNFSILEYAHGDAPWRFELTDPPEPLEKGGMLRIPDRPGLGYKLNMKNVERHKA